MIDAIDLVFFQGLLDVGIERVRRFEIASERLLDDDAAPTSILFGGQARIAELLDRDREESRRDGQVEKAIALGRMLLVDFVDHLG